ncbi:MAG: hypothetical protein ABIV50_07730 [Opitutus sp.]
MAINVSKVKERNGKARNLVKPAIHLTDTALDRRENGQCPLNQVGVESKPPATNLSGRSLLRSMTTSATSNWSRFVFVLGIVVSIADFEGQLQR